MTMRTTGMFLTLLTLVGSISSPAVAVVADKCFTNLPSGCYVTRSFIVPREQAEAVGQKLGAPVVKLSNTFLTVSGAPIQVNILDAKTEEDAIILKDAISGMKGHPAFCLKIGKRVVEYVGNDPAFATKTSYELGFIPKPKEVRYRITANISTIDKSDYMSFNKLFNVFLTTDTSRPGKEALSEITSLSKGFQFGSSLTMRSPDIGKSKSAYKFTPDSHAQQPEKDVVTYVFDNPPKLLGIPYVTATIEISTDETGSAPTTRKADEILVSATEFWPSNDPNIKETAGNITTGKQTTEEKVQAILEWLTPGKNIKFGGPVTGSRWGVKKVLEQKFGQCWDFSDCFVTFCRASGIPCRQVGGWLYGGSGHI